MGEIRDRFNRRLSALKTERSSFESSWQDLATYILPYAPRFISSDRNRGDRRNQKINDSTATMASRVLTSGMAAGITPRSRPWFLLRTPDEDLNEYYQVKIWLDTARERMAKLFLSSNLYTTLINVYEDLGVFGTSAFTVLEHEKEFIRTVHAPVGSYWLGTDGWGVVDLFYREYEMTASQMVKMFGYENCSDSVRSASRNTRDSWFKVVHAIEPNDSFNPGRIEAKFKRYRSVYYEAAGSDDKFLRESGYDEFPVMAPRWQIAGEDIYGTRCPGIDAIGDVKTLQVEQLRKAQLIAKQVNPPINAPASMKNRELSLLPGGINFSDTPQMGLTPVYQVQHDFRPLLQDIAENQARIDKCFFKDLFLLIANDDRSNITAAEIIARKEEKMLMIAPVLERVDDELLDPLIDRVFAMMWRQSEPIWAGRINGIPLLPPPPAELNQMDLQVEYTSTLHQAMKLAGISSIEHLASFTGSLAGAYPDVVDNLDADEAVRQMGSMLGAAPKVLRDPELVNKQRAARQQQQQMQQMLSMAQQGADTAKVLSDTNVTDPSALTAMQAAIQGY